MDGLLRTLTQAGPLGRLESSPRYRGQASRSHTQALQTLSQQQPLSLSRDFSTCWISRQTAKPSKFSLWAPPGAFLPRTFFHFLILGSMTCQDVYHWAFSEANPGSGSIVESWARWEVMMEKVGAEQQKVRSQARQGYFSTPVTALSWRVVRNHKIYCGHREEHSGPLSAP